MTRGRGSHRKRVKHPDPISGAVEEMLANLGIPAIRSIVLLSRGWETVCGELLSRKTAPSELRNGTLTILVSNHSWAQELQFSKPLLLERVAGLLGAGVVTDIRFTVGPIPEDEPEIAPAPAPRPPSTVPLPEPEGLSGIDDPELRATLLSLQRKAFDHDQR